MQIWHLSGCFRSSWRILSALVLVRRKQYGGVRNVRAAGLRLWHLGVSTEKRRPDRYVTRLPCV
jgi:hypothetical protein